MKNKELSKWLTVKEVVGMTGLNRMTILSYIKKGIFEADRVSYNKRAPWHILTISIPAYLRDNLVEECRKCDKCKNLKQHLELCRKEGGDNHGKT